MVAPIERERERRDGGRERRRRTVRTEKLWFGERSAGADGFYSGRENLAFDFVLYCFVEAGYAYGKQWFEKVPI
jgi:hypothetical protein